MSDQPVLTEARDGVLLVTLNRPEARNAVNLALAEGLAAALDALDGDPDRDEAEFWERQGALAAPVFTSEDAREGATAFAEKREPVWRGR